ncbi:MAG: glycosyltransferase family 2 protein [Verrucomicrobia bacterium]|nr:glycosyltransferase family 2 protein [Verrucomicrobiota bacterium]
MTTRFKIVVPSYNSAAWIGKTLSSLESQTYKNYDVCVIDDASTQEEQRQIIASFVARNGWKAIYNPTNCGTLENLVKGVKALECVDEDVIVVLDGDDWLFNERVLEYVNQVYEESRPLLTYGQYVRYNTGEIGCCREASWVTRRFNLYRKRAWRYTHLRTYKYLLWRHLRDEDLRGEDGRYWQVCADLATMFPMLEMAGKQVVFIKRILLVYNDTNPINDERVRRQEQLRINRLIRALPKYQRLTIPSA